MNEPTDCPPERCCKNLKNYLSENPTQAMLAAAGIGLVIALILRPRKPVRPEYRSLQILEEIQHRLKEIAEPVYRRAISAADRGVAAAKDGVEYIEEMDLPSSFCSLRRKIGRLFH